MPRLAAAFIIFATLGAALEVVWMLQGSESLGKGLFMCAFGFIVVTLFAVYLRKK